MLTTKKHVCKKCGHIYQPSASPAFVKTSVDPCPNCGSGKISLVGSSNKAQIQSKAITEKVKGVVKKVL